MRRLFAFVFAAFALSASIPALADQQVSQDEWRRGSVPPFAKRSDGLYYDPTNKIPRLIGNGDGFSNLGPTYFEDFDYGDGLGIMCESVARIGNNGFTVAASANAACNTTCGNSACVMGFEASLDAAADLLLCDDATADGCLCQVTSLDHELQGCGSGWESPALGITLMSFDRGTKLAYVALLAQDIGPDMDATSLDIGSDQTDNDGVEVLGGMYGASGRPLVPGVDPAFKFCAKVSIGDVSGTDEFWIGFRDLTEPNATFNSYNSYAVIGIDAADGDWATETEDDGGGTTTTDIAGVTNATDGSIHTACVLVSDAGAVSYSLNGGTPTGAVAYTLDVGQGVIPFLHYLHATTSPGEIDLINWVVSYQ